MSVDAGTSCEVGFVDDIGSNIDLGEECNMEDWAAADNGRLLKGPSNIARLVGMLVRLHVACKWVGKYILHARLTVTCKIKGVYTVLGYLREGKHK